ncbi:hypothetical protein D1AOALGA4SA_9746 [Olavius algarvensis Delta 1 endosymbiont]|nr:hypothetical protein D1AOALGA4SA_9746 [Olavius algarvensis Delta 1 endosymbiont]
MLIVKPHRSIIVVAALILVIPTFAVGDLMPFEGRSDEWLVRDMETDEVWISDLTIFSSLDYGGVNDKIGELNSDEYGGADSWELASLEQIEVLFNSIETLDDADLFDATSISGDDRIWYGRSTTEVSGGNARRSPIIEYSNGILEKDSTLFVPDFADAPILGAWVKTTDYPSSPVPEPTSILLLVPGMMALAWFRKRFWRT